MRGVYVRECVCESVCMFVCKGVFVCEIHCVCVCMTETLCFYIAKCY